MSAEIDQRLADLAARLKASPGEGSDRAHRLRLAALIADRDEMARVLAAPKVKPTVPPGMPIGDDGEY
uniref:Uncharacterized protein n=1 Tax=Phenylobacterium glaciei TaxID=2803784 RepID=A0A974P378_9CAUL|nr:hypothetical protein JKL49_02025 [Phenylobacterium glaciei]